jgi:hypothetical protein
VQKIDSSHALEQRAGKMQGAAGAGRCESEFSRCSFASAITSATERAGTDAVTVMISGNLASSITGAKSFAGS